MSKASAPFTFDDLAGQGHKKADAAFISFFHPVAAEMEKNEPVDGQSAPSPEDQVRKVFEDAFAQGEKAGRDMGMRRVEAVVKRLEKHIEELASFRVALEGKYERLAVDLALKAAEAIVLRECAQHRDILTAMIKKAMEMCEEKSDIVIRIRPEDASLVKTAIDADRIRVVADEGLQEPGFTIETRVGDIDGRISSQIEELKRALLGDHE